MKVHKLFSKSFLITYELNDESGLILRRERGVLSKDPIINRRKNKLINTVRTSKQQRSFTLKEIMEKYGL